VLESRSTLLRFCAEAGVVSLRDAALSRASATSEPTKIEAAARPKCAESALAAAQGARRPTIEELEAILREPDGTYEVHILPNGEVHSRRILKAVEPEPGEAKKEEGT
jgi:hypothetical protein